MWYCNRQIIGKHNKNMNSNFIDNFEFLLLLARVKCLLHDYRFTNNYREENVDNLTTTQL